MKWLFKKASHVYLTAVIIFSLLWIALSLKGTAPSNQFVPSNIGGLSSVQYEQLSKLDFKSGQNAVYYVNNNNSTLNFSAWKNNSITFSNLDSLNRTSGSATAYLEGRNIANQALRSRQNIKPTGWHYPYKNGIQVYNRGHLIAYSVSGGINNEGKYVGQASGDQNNPKNLFTQSAYANQEVQTYYESQVRNALKAGKRVIYQATPIFRGNELMARGINLQAVTSDRMLNFNVYIFNVQPNIAFNYSTGASTADSGMKVIFQP